MTKEAETTSPRSKTRRQYPPSICRSAGWKSHRPQPNSGANSIKKISDVAGNGVIWCRTSSNHDQINMPTNQDRQAAAKKYQALTSRGSHRRAVRQHNSPAAREPKVQKLSDQIDAVSAVRPKFRETTKNSTRAIPTDNLNRVFWLDK